MIVCVHLERVPLHGGSQSSQTGYATSSAAKLSEMRGAGTVSTNQGSMASSISSSLCTGGQRSARRGLSLLMQYMTGSLQTLPGFCPNSLALQMRVTALISYMA